MNRFWISAYLLFFGLSTASGQQVLDAYIREGFAKNKSLQQQHIAFQKSLHALKEAKSLFLPSVSLLGNYFLAEGGRTVDFPAGDLLNPVYRSLNQLTASSQFPELKNESILLNPNNFYDLRVRGSMPLLNAEIEYNRRIKKEQITLQQIEIDLYKRELVKEIKQAYFRYMQALDAIQVYQSATLLAAEGLRINQSLFKNNKANRTLVLRAENELVRYQTLAAQAGQNAASAKAYFNFLLNKNLEDSILIDSGYLSVPALLQTEMASGQREELQKLGIAGNISSHLKGMSQAYLIPKLSTFLDLGSQGFEWKYDNKTRYYFFGLALQWDLFNSGRNRHKSRQAELDQQINKLQTETVDQQIELQQTIAEQKLNNALLGHQGAAKSYITAQANYEDAIKLYREGQLSYIELLDAQNQQVQSALQLGIARTETYLQAAETERAHASFNIN